MLPYITVYTTCFGFLISHHQVLSSLGYTWTVCGDIIGIGIRDLVSEC